MAMQALAYASEVLKNYYLPVWNRLINIEPSPFLEKVKKVPLKAFNIVASAELGANGGVGFGSELSAVPTPGGQRYESFTINPVALYANVEITDMAIKLGKTPDGATVTLLDREIRGAYDAAKWNLARSLFGDGTGILGTFSSLINNTATFAIDTIENVMVGLYIDIYNVDGGTVTRVTTGGPVRIVNVDRGNKTITVDSAVKTTHGGFITLQGSYNYEVTGLKAIFDSNVPSLYGVTKSGNSWILPEVVNADGELTDIVLYQAVEQARRIKGTNIDLVMMSDDAFLAYQNYMRESNVTIVENAMYEGGAAGYKVVVGNKKVEIVNEPFIPAGKAWCVDTSKFEFHTTDITFADEQDANVFVRMENYPRYRALLVQYCNLICTNPGGCVEIQNCVE